MTEKRRQAMEKVWVDATGEDLRVGLDQVVRTLGHEPTLTEWRAIVKHSVSAWRRYQAAEAKPLFAAARAKRAAERNGQKSGVKS